jgi:hypothetical protein
MDFLAWFDNGLLSEIIITGPDPDSPRKKQRFYMNKLVGAEYDADGDGEYDTEYEYDFYEEISSEIRR